MRRAAVFAAAIATAIATSLVAPADAQTCSVPTSTFTFSCDASCLPNQSCVRKSSASCSLECFAAATGDWFYFLVPLDTAGGGDTAAVPSKSNSELTKVAKLLLPSNVLNIAFHGGNSLTTYTDVATVEFADDFLATNTQLDTVRLTSLDLAASINTLAANLPPQVKRVWLRNDFIKTFPTEFTSFKSLQHLALDYNRISQVDSSHEIASLNILHLDNNQVSSFTAVYPNLTELNLTNNVLTEVPAVIPKHAKLKTLSLRGNNISEFKQQHVTSSIKTLVLSGNGLKRFDAYLPNLEDLDLSNNALDAIPSAIFNHSTLKTLALASNKLKGVTLTNKQALFLASLTTLTIGTGVFNTNCAGSEQYNVKNFTVCISSSATQTPTSDGDGASSNILAIVIGCVVGVVVVALIAAFVIWKKRRGSSTQKGSNSDNTTNYTAGSDTLTGVPSSSVALWNDRSLLAVRVATDDIQDVRKIDSGAFCDVWLVVYRNSRQVASKRLREVTLSRTQQFIEEIKLVATLKHPNIVSFVGAAWTQEADLQALFEFMDGGDLRDHLANSNTPREWTLEKLQIAIDIVEALVYVHSFLPPLVHRDLKSRNVLLGNSDDGDTTALRAKLTDFGVSRFRSEDNTMTAGVGTGKWLAPEVIAGANDYGPAADIFSFGVVLSELDTHKLPYEGVCGANGNKLADVAMLQLVASGELRPSFSASCPEEIVEIAQRCLSFRPVERPNALEVAYALRSFKRSLPTAL